MGIESKYHTIYKTINLLNGKFYVGLHSTNNLDDGYLGSGTTLLKAVNKYGKDNFKREILEFCDCREDLVDREMYWIQQLDALNREIGYNIRLDAASSGFYGKGFTEESKEKLRQANLGKKQSISTINKRVKSRVGYKHSEETKRKIGEANKGHILSEEAKQRMISKLTGRKRTYAEKLAISKAQIGKKPKQIQCPHCRKVGGNNVMKRHHFDNCKLKAA